MSHHKLPLDVQQLQLQNQKQSAANSEEELPAKYNEEGNIEEIQTTTCIEEEVRSITLTAETVPEPMDVSSTSTLEASATHVKAAAGNKYTPARIERRRVAICLTTEDDADAMAALDWQGNLQYSLDVGPPKRMIVRPSDQSASAGVPSSISQLEFAPAPKKLVDVNWKLRAATRAAFRTLKGRTNRTASSISKRGANFATSGSSSAFAAYSSGGGGNVRTVSRRLFQSTGTYMTVVIHKCRECKTIGFDVVARENLLQGPVGIVIRAIFSNNEATVLSCFKGDQIMAINGTPCQNLPHEEAVKLLKNVKPGPVQLRIYRSADGDESLIANS